MSTRLLLLALLATATWLPLRAQTDKPSADTTKFRRYRVISPGLSLPLLRDEAVSPLRYLGPGVMLMLNAWQTKPKVFKQMVAKTDFALMSNTANSNALTFLHLSFDYNYYRKVKSYHDDRLRLFAGGGADALLYLKLLSLNVNNQLGYDFATSLKVAGLLQYDFRLFRRNFTLTEQLSVPLLSVLSRPPFSWPAPYDAYEPGGSWTSAFAIASFGNYLRLQNRLSLDWFPTEKRRRKARHLIASHWRLTYHWDYTQINRPNVSKIALPSLSLGRVVQF